MIDKREDTRRMVWMRSLGKRWVCILILITFFCTMGATGAALNDWIETDGSRILFKTDCGNTLIYSGGVNQAHLSDFIHDGSSYGGSGARDYTLYEASYFNSAGAGAGQCHETTANFKGLVYYDDTVAVVESGCAAQDHQEMWRYVIPRHQCGFFETERKDLHVYYEAQNNEQVQILNSSIFTRTRFYSSTRDGNIAGGTGYIPLFSQFSNENMPFEWTMGYDPAKNVSISWIHTGSDSIARTAHRRYFTGANEQQVDFAGSGEASRTEMPLGATWLETWKGIVRGNQNSVKAQALSLVGHVTDEQITPFFSVASASGNLVVKTGSLAYEPKPYIGYDVPYGSGSSGLITEYPYVNGNRAETGSNLTSGEDFWNSSYRNPDMSYGWLKYRVGNGSYEIRNQRTAYRDADGLIWMYNITALNAGNMAFSVNYGYPYGIPAAYSPVITDTTFSFRTTDPLEGEYGLTFIFSEPITVTPSGSSYIVTLPERSMNVGDTASYTIYAIPHKWSTSVSVGTFHTREKTSMKIPYRVLQTGLEWMPTDAVTAYEGISTDAGYRIGAYSEAGTHTIRIFSDRQVQSLEADSGSITYDQAPDGTITAQWTVPTATVGKITMITDSSALGALFTANVTSGTAPLAVRFSDASMGIGISAWNWSFRDVTGNNTEVWWSTEQNPVRTFGAGNYSIRLNASSSSAYNLSTQVTFINVTAAVSNDGIAIFRPASGYWYFDNNPDGIVDTSFRFGGSADQNIKGDWNGDGSDGIAIFRPASGYWYFDNNLDGIVDTSFRYGGSTDKIVVGSWI